MAEETRTPDEVEALTTAFEALRPLNYAAQLRAVKWLTERLDHDRRRRSSVKVGDRARHTTSGWAGLVTDVQPDTSGMAGSQGALVTVKPDHPRPADAPPEWAGWRDITVTADELELAPAQACESEQGNETRCD